MITVHHLRHSRSQRIPWLLEELGVDYDIVDHGRIRGLSPPTLQAVHPLGKAPVIVDEGQVIAESGAIIEHLVHRYGGGRLGPPVDAAGRHTWNYWMHYAEGSLMPLVVMRMIFQRMQRARWPVKPLLGSVLKPVRRGYLEPNLVRHMDWVDAALVEQAWFAGDDFSAADIQMSVPLLALTRPGDGRFSHLSNIRGFLRRIQAREAYRRAAERLAGCEQSAAGQAV